MVECAGTRRVAVVRRAHMENLSLKVKIMKKITLAGLLMTFVLCGGCETAAKTGFKVAKGVDAEVLPISGALTPSTLAPYNTLKLGNVSTDIGRLCPAGVIAEVRKSAPKIFAERTREHFGGGPKILTANIVVRFYKKKDLLGAGRLDLLATLVDAGSGTEIGKVHIEGITESPVHTGIDDMVEETIKRLADYLTKKKG